MKAFYCDHFEVPLPERHRFPMQKYALVRAALVERSVLPALALCAAEPVDLAAVLRVHTGDYVRAFTHGELERRAVSRIGFPWSQALVQRCLASVGGTLAASAAALHDGMAGALAGGTHHAHADFGAGYCVFNDIAIAIAAQRAAGQIERALVIDLDVHQGDGTAAIFAGDANVYTFSMHGAHNFPARKATSDLDLALADETGDAHYLALLARELPQLFERARPDIVFYQAGVDALASDRLGRLALSHAGLAERDRLVISETRKRRIALVLTLGGGYAEPVSDTVDAHVNTYRSALRCTD